MQTIDPWPLGTYTLRERHISNDYTNNSAIIILVSAMARRHMMSRERIIEGLEQICTPSTRQLSPDGALPLEGKFDILLEPISLSGVCKC